MNQIQLIDALVWSWLALALLSTLYVAYDQFLGGNPEPAVMKWGFVLVTLYMGPLGLLLYVMADKEPKPGSHEVFVRPLWKQGVGSTVHCVAGDATGIIVAAAVTATLGLPMGLDIIVEYVAGFAFGLFIFQALFMKTVMGGSYWENVRRTFVPEWLSMNLMMAGMIPVMVFLMMSRDMRAMQPEEPLFWVVMSLGIIAGFAVTYPINVWLVSRGLKHGLITVRPGQQRSSMEGVGSPASNMAGMNHGAGGMNSGSMPGMDHGSGGAMKPQVTRLQLGAVAMITVLALIAAYVLPATQVNLGLSARSVGGAVMPPGMITSRDTPAEAMRDMAAIDPRRTRYLAPVEAKGAQPLQPRLEGGVKVFDFEVSQIGWNILSGVRVDAYAVNRQVPGPTIRITEGDRVRFNVKNNLSEATSIHWHGMILPNNMDGVAGVTQASIEPGQSYTYEFTARQTGTYFYHSHKDSDRQQGVGLYGALIIDPKIPPANPGYDQEYTIQLQEWLLREGLTYPAMIMEGALPNYFTINGKAYPQTDTIRLRAGQRVLLRFIGSNNNFVHPMHVHGGPFEVIARDGETLQPSARFLADTVNVGPGQRYDVIWTAREPGKWLVHCHIPHHTKNNNVEEKGGGGLTMILEVAG